MTQQPWPDELIAEIGIETIMKLRTMRRSEAERWLHITYDHPDGQKVLAYKDTILSITQPDLTAVAKFVPSNAYLAALKAHRTRAVFCASAWAAGASWGQLGAMFDIKRQSVMSSASKHLPVDRLATRMSNSPIPLERLSAWYNWYMSALDEIEGSEMGIQHIATRFLTIVDD